MKLLKSRKQPAGHRDTPRIIHFWFIIARAVCFVKCFEKKTYKISRYFSFNSSIFLNKFSIFITIYHFITPHRICKDNKTQSEHKTHSVLRFYFVTAYGFASASFAAFLSVISFSFIVALSGKNVIVSSEIPVIFSNHTKPII